MVHTKSIHLTSKSQEYLYVYKTKANVEASGHQSPFNKQPKETRCESVVDILTIMWPSQEEKKTTQMFQEETVCVSAEDKGTDFDAGYLLCKISSHRQIWWSGAGFSIQRLCLRPLWDHYTNHPMLFLKTVENTFCFFNTVLRNGRGAR